MSVSEAIDLSGHSSAQDAVKKLKSSTSSGAVRMGSLMLFTPPSLAS